mmetsp:Transcript_135443/g.235551  ORF Transcript_135443/g.235551 Transcript_135443/m.235551 type:complete len:118 (-) Transcript_135443:1320-1673(-)
MSTLCISMGCTPVSLNMRNTTSGKLETWRWLSLRRNLSQPIEDSSNFCLRTDREEWALEWALERAFFAAARSGAEWALESDHRLSTVRQCKEDRVLNLASDIHFPHQEESLFLMNVV